MKDHPETIIPDAKIIFQNVKQTIENNAPTLLPNKDLILNKSQEVSFKLGKNCRLVTFGDAQNKIQLSIPILQTILPGDYSAKIQWNFMDVPQDELSPILPKQASKKKLQPPPTQQNFVIEEKDIEKLKYDCFYLMRIIYILNSGAFKYKLADVLTYLNLPTNMGCRLESDFALEHVKYMPKQIQDDFKDYCKNFKPKPTFLNIKDYKQYVDYSVLFLSFSQQYIGQGKKYNQTNYHMDVLNQNFCNLKGQFIAGKMKEFKSRNSVGMFDFESSLKKIIGPLYFDEYVGKYL
ncbi:MAG: hypothetical protein LBT69_03310 [Lactobacillales bacterium]|nr:hypothetical protein [Lactobacillales bacterium]